VPPYLTLARPSQMCACREDEWDKMLLGKKTPAHMAVELQKEVVDKGFELVLDKGRIHGFPKFRYSHITVRTMHPTILGYSLQPIPCS
jgi:hypothetical protein